MLGHNSESLHKLGINVLIGMHYRGVSIVYSEIRTKREISKEPVNRITLFLKSCERGEEM